MAIISLGEGISCISDGLRTQRTRLRGEINLGAGVTVDMGGISLTAGTGGGTNPFVPPPGGTNPGSFSASFSRSFSGGGS